MTLSDVDMAVENHAFMSIKSACIDHFGKIAALSPEYVELVQLVAERAFMAP
jgi:hypothetical protein